MCFCRFCQLQVTTVQVSIDLCRRIWPVVGAVKGHRLLNVRVTFKRSEWFTFAEGRGSLSVFTEALNDSLFGDRSHIWCCCIWSQLNHWEKPPSLLAIASTAKTRLLSHTSDVLTPHRQITRETSRGGGWNRRFFKAKQNKTKKMMLLSSLSFSLLVVWLFSSASVIYKVTGR